MRNIWVPETSEPSYHSLPPTPGHRGGLIDLQTAALSLISGENPLKLHLYFHNFTANQPLYATLKK